MMSKFLLPIALATIDNIAIPIKAVKKDQVGTCMNSLSVSMESWYLFTVMFSLVAQ